MIRRLTKSITAYCTPESCKVGAIISTAGAVHRITSISESGLVTMDVVGKDYGRIGKVNKERTEIQVDLEHDWKAQQTVALQD